MLLVSKETAKKGGKIRGGVLGSELRRLVRATTLTEPETVAGATGRSLKPFGSWTAFSSPSNCTKFFRPL